MTTEQLARNLLALIDSEMYVNDFGGLQAGRDATTGIHAAMGKLEEALAQPVQERFLVATIGNWGRVEWADGVSPSIGDKMYSAPRTWVGLTVDELIELERKHGSHESLTRAIDDMLKGKNS